MKNASPKETLRNVLPTEIYEVKLAMRFLPALLPQSHDNEAPAEIRALPPAAGVADMDAIEDDISVDEPALPVTQTNSKY